MKRYVCEQCSGLGQIQVALGRPDASGDEEWDIEPCPTCVAKGYPPFINANTPFDNAQIDIVKEKVDASAVQVVSASNPV